VASAVSYPRRRVISVASWNVNSIRARIDRVTAWVDLHKPDVLCMQELKVDRKEFPFEVFRERGYHFHGVFQRTYNGVGIASRVPLESPTVGFDDGQDETQARVVAGTVAGVRVICAYFPNGQSLGSDKYEYKLAWMKRLRAHLDRTCKADEKLLLCGDFNVAPEERDVHDPRVWAGSTLFHQSARDALAHVADFGLVDTLRLHRQDAGLFSWWDYRMLAFPRNLGLRIDHVYVTKPLAELCREVVIDRDARKGKLPSDHAPVIARFDIAVPADVAPPPPVPPPGQGSLPL
jgi:exodeoxyribonuclease III